MKKRSQVSTRFLSWVGKVQANIEEGRAKQIAPFVIRARDSEEDRWNYMLEENTKPKRCFTVKDAVAFAKENDLEIEDGKVEVVRK